MNNYIPWLRELNVPTFEKLGKTINTLKYLINHHRKQELFGGSNPTEVGLVTESPRRRRETLDAREVSKLFKINEKFKISELSICEIFSDNFAIFQNNLKFYRILSASLGKMLEKF